MSPNSAHSPNNFMARARIFARCASVFVMLVGAAVLTGWLLDVPGLKGIYADITMKANAALALLLAGAALGLLNFAGEKSFARRSGQTCAALVALIGALTLSEHLIGWNLGIDQLLFTEPAGALATASPGRMGVNASSCFTLAGSALLLLYARRAVALAQLLAATVSLLALLPLLGYAYKAAALYGIAQYTGIALHTAVALFVLSLGLLATRADTGGIAVLSSGRAGGLLARRLLFMAVVVPFLLGWLCLRGQQAGYYDLGFGTALLVLTIIIIFTTAIWLSAVKLDDVEQQQLAAEATVREKEAGLQQQAALIELSYEPIFVWSFEQGIVEWNKGCEQLYGYTRAEAVAQVSHQLLHTQFPLSLEAHLQNLSDAGYWSGELRQRTRAGQDVLIESRQQLLVSQGQRLVLETNRDITERKRVETERAGLLASEQAARLQAEAANRLKDEFLATVSHELRTPLNAVLGWATMLRGHKLEAAAVPRALETIERNARAQAQLIEDLLDVSRIISGKLRLEVKAIELNAVMQAALDAVRPAAEAKELQLQAFLDPAAAAMQGDAARLQQVWWNLLANAVKFTPKGGRVTVRLERVAGKVQFTVSDTGEGISPAFLPHVFDRFQQADGSITRRHGGLGLGLAIARHLVEMHGGTLTADSPGEGQGATFTVRLPVQAVPAPNVATAEAQVQPASPRADSPRNEATPPLQGLRILGVDDEPDMRAMLKGVLEHYGAEVLTVAAAAEALTALAAWRPDVLVCDIGMPAEDGYTLIRKLRALPTEQGGQTPAIALTGYVRAEERVRALAAGYQMFVPKPVEAAELAVIIANLVAPAANPTTGQRSR